MHSEAQGLREGVYYAREKPRNVNFHSFAVEVPRKRGWKKYDRGFRGRVSRAQTDVRDATKKLQEDSQGFGEYYIPWANISAYQMREIEEELSLSEGMNQELHFGYVTFEVPSRQLRSLGGCAICLTYRGRCFCLGVGDRWVNREFH